MDDQASHKETNDEQDIKVSPSLAEQDPAEASLTIFFKRVGLIILLVFLCVFVASLGIQEGLSSICLGDVSLNINVFTFIDENADGIYQNGEPHLPEVGLWLDSSDDNSVDSIPSEKTNWSGEFSLKGGVTGCDWEVPIRVEAPAGYRLTTPDVLVARQKDDGRPLQFGFTYLPGIPTATPRPTTTCSFIPELNGKGVSAIVSDDENLWIAAYEVAKLNFMSNTWTFFDNEAYTGWPQNILVSPDGNIWLITTESNPKWSPQTAGDSDEPIYFSYIYQLIDGQWRAFSPEILYHKQVESITWAPDNRMLFSTASDGVIIFNSTANIWNSDTSVKPVYKVLFANDGKYLVIDDVIGGGEIAPDGKIWGVSDDDRDCARFFL